MRNYRVSDVIEKIIAYSNVDVPPEWLANDRLIAGDVNAEVRGIAVAFMATADVIRKAHQCGANLLITHEPTWYIGNDDNAWLDDDPVLAAKQALISETRMNIWRYHDHMHAHIPDEIYRGLVNALGWEEYERIPQHGEYAVPAVLSPERAAGFIRYYALPKVSAVELAEEVGRRLGQAVPRVLGKPGTIIERAGILVGYHSVGLGDEVSPMRLMHSLRLNTMLCGELHDWTFPAYINDSAQLGLQRTLLVLGHRGSEAPGMRYFAAKLTDILDSPLPVTFIDG